ncbi:MAG: TonB family protein [Neomegalonema sp.]|nr:TonB family protein [Neomegalonema sp.]
MILRGDFLICFLISTSALSAVGLWSDAEPGRVGGSEMGSTFGAVGVIASTGQAEALVRQWQTSPKPVSDLPADLQAPAPTSSAASIDRSDPVPAVPLPVSQPDIPQMVDPPAVIEQPYALETSVEAPVEAIPPEMAPERVALRPKPRPDRPKVPRSPSQPSQAVGEMSEPGPRLEGARQASAGQAQASGAQTQASVGQTQASAGSPGLDGETEQGRLDALSQWGREIHRAIARSKHYPPRARARGVTGSVRLILVVARNGRLIEAILERSSGSALLDKAALRAAQRAAPFSAAPAAIGADGHRFATQVRFDLN